MMPLVEALAVAETMRDELRERAEIWRGTGGAVQADDYEREAAALATLLTVIGRLQVAAAQLQLPLKAS